MKYMKIILLNLSVFYLFSLFYPFQVWSDGYGVSSNRTYLKAQFIPALWQEAISNIRKITKVPILVPREIPKLEDSRLDNGMTIFGNSDGNANKYTLEIGLEKKCNWPRNCILFEINGELTTKKTETWEKIYQYMLDISKGHARYCKKNPYPSCSEVIQERKNLLSQVRRVNLAKGVKGIFLPRYCFSTGCLPAQIIWRTNIYQYRIRLRDMNRYPLDELVRLANSAIENQ
jgi:hypothetical protein